MIIPRIFLKSMLISSMLFVFGKQDLSAFQDSIPIKRSHAISSQGSMNAPVPTTGTLNVVAIMVEFQPDSNRFTSGTGIFGTGGLPYLERATDFKVEPLPHDQNYFESHLEFAKNYFEQSSDGQLTLNYQVLPDVYRLDNKMEFYSPIGEVFTNEQLALLIRDSWEKVEQNGGFDATGLIPEETAFVIFHAGIGRDIELTGTTLDITPQDIPSIYLRQEQIGDLLGQPGFTGIPVNNGAFRVTNSMIIPRTQSRRGLDIQDNEFVFPLSINGLLCASIGSHMGLPDLFNTETGDPAIGRFGLMDGAGFFAYNGLLPPEPSAWSKTLLGWQNAVELDIQSSPSYSLNTASAVSSDNIARVSLSQTEYFLLENRHRDPDGTGVTITTVNSDGNISQKTFTNLDNGFVFQESGFDSLLDAGVIINSDNFDFSLPGGLDIGEDGLEGTADDRILNGGILIWHIDEGIINDQLSEDRVNADIRRRGIDLEEADGAQDIGPGIPGALDNSAAFGSPYDFWWSGNNFRVITQFGEIQLYRNEFGPDTRPDNASNSGAPSFFEITNISENLPIASFDLSAVDIDGLSYEPVLSLVLNDGPYSTPSNTYWSGYPLSLSYFSAASDSFIVIPSGEGLSVLRSGDSVPFSLTSNAPQQPLLLDRIFTAGNPELPASNDRIDIEAFSWDAGNNIFNTDFNIDAAENRGFISSFNGDTLFIEQSPGVITLNDDTYLPNEVAARQRSGVLNNLQAASTGNEVVFSNGLSFDDGGPVPYRLYTGSYELGDRALFYILTDGSLILADPESADPFRVLFEREQTGWPAFSSDGRIYVVNLEENTLEGYTPNGALIDNTPINAPKNVRFTGTPIIADIDGDLEQDILVTGQDSSSLNIYAYDLQGRLFEGFPLFAGSAAGNGDQMIHPVFSGDTLYAVGSDGTLKGWRFDNAGEISWPSVYGNAVFRGNIVSAVSEITDPGSVPDFGILNKNETYNWPNPADEQTFIRFQSNQSGTVKVTIADLSGRVVYETQKEHVGGFPEEIEINTSDWASGPYFAVLKVTVDGRSESRLIKIAVVH